MRPGGTLTATVKTEPRSTVNLFVYYIGPTGHDEETIKPAENQTGTISRSFKISSTQELTERGFIQAMAYTEGFTPDLDDVRNLDRIVALEPFRVAEFCPTQ